ncbi:MAG: helix-turn-helix domain-containing protein [Bacteroidaceae bacterium]|nr:helix-turn-helix domain-containing protein [Bacteroidaceae bacterium]
MTENDFFLNAVETAQLLRTSVGYVRKLTSLKQLPHFKINRKVLYRRSEVIALIEAGRVATTSELAEQADTNAMRRLMRRKEVVS